MATPKQHIEAIRSKKFSIGAEVENPLTEDLHEAVKHLSAELYAKDVHFLMELIQNAEDNEYPDGVDPSLEFIVTSRDITKTGALATLMIFNNEKGFSAKNIDSICSVGRSSKKGNRKRGYIGEKGIGFKSVFLITSHPYIFSNGYKIRFNEEPCPHCNVGYVVPEWVEESPTLSEIHQIYGVGTALPTTTIVLPLKPDKVKPVKDQLSSIHPEVLLFLSNIKKLSVKEDNVDPKLNTVNAISILREKNFATRKNIDAESYTLFLSAGENSNASDTECSYNMWKQKFPVKKENRVERRMEIEEWMITLAFPLGERLQRGTSSPGLYAFLPTEMVTNFPFIIQADFLLGSSRESLLLGNKWNEGILSCVPSAFINALVSMIKTSENAPPSCLPNMFEYLPVSESSYRELNNVRESIRLKLVDEDIVPCESYTSQRFFHKPREVGRLMPAFWDILDKARKQDLSLHYLSSHDRHILISSFDKVQYDGILNFMGVKPVDFEWYAKCIQSSNLVLGVSELVYLELLVFCAENWSSYFHNTNLAHIPILKYAYDNGCVSSCSVTEAKRQNGEVNLLFSRELRNISWLINCNKEFKCLENHFFMPASTQETIRQSNKRDQILQWLKDYAGISVVTVYDFANLVLDNRGNDKKFVVAFVHFLFHSLEKDYMSEVDVKKLCTSSLLPLEDKYERVYTKWKGVLVPARGSKWADLVDYNPWKEDGYIELGQVYSSSGNFAGLLTSENQLLDFLKTYVGASDIPDLPPPNAEIRTMATPLTKSNVLMLLVWIKNLNYKSVRMPDTFLRSIKEGCWLKTSLGYKPPSQSFMPTSLGSILQNGSVFVDIPLIDLQYYGEEAIKGYTQELKAIGVMSEYGEACEFIGKYLMTLAAYSNLTKANVFSILKFIKFLRENYLSPEQFINSIKKGKWMKTSLGYRCPTESVFYSHEWKAASQICDIAFVDKAYYGEEIDKFESELKLLGVVIGFNKSYQLVSDCLKHSSYLGSLTAEAFILILQCLRHLTSSDKIVKSFKDTEFLNTNIGYRSPRETFLFYPEWGTLLQVFNCFPLIDTKFYGKDILSYSEELMQLGVTVDFEEAAKAFAVVFKNKAKSIGKQEALLFLECYRKLDATSHSHKSLDLKKCISEKWLRTRLGDYRSPNECILFGSGWESIAPVTLLPFIDDTQKYFGKSIYEYQKELKCMGVITDFKDGVKLITANLYLSVDPLVITRENMNSILDCVRIILEDRKDSSLELLESFKKKVQKKWVKTSAGYRSPDECLLYGSKWVSFLKPNDGPFIDNDFYGSQIMTYVKELNAIGVTVDVSMGGELLFNNLCLHSDFTTIARIYSYLNEVNWLPGKEASREIWIPNGTENGKWVNPKSCVLHDKDGLFESRLNVLEKHYERKLLSFFSCSFDVNSNPTVDDYCKLWNDWECSGRQLSHEDCFAFWGYVAKHWSSKTEKTLVVSIVKLPVYSDSEGISLLDKRDVFIADDLQLKELLDQALPHSIFVWCPQSSLPPLHRTKLIDIYRKIGVRTISESVKKEELLYIMNCVERNEIDPNRVFIGKELVKLILGVLAGPSINMEAEKRQKAVNFLIHATVLITADPIAVSYSLTMSSGKVISVSASRMIRWDRAQSILYMQKFDKPGGYKKMIEYATHFSEVIAEGLLWENAEFIHELSEFVKLAFMVEFDDEAVSFMMKNKNLMIFGEDEEFLLSAFPSDKVKNDRVLD